MTGSADRQDPQGQRDGHSPHPEALAPGTVVAGKYRVERTIGAGGMGVVVVAYHVALAQRVAVKFMRPEAASDTNAIGRFLREARAAASLSNEHVTRVLDVGTLENGAPYLVMEYLAGIDVSEALRRDGPMSVPLAVEVVLQACEALAEAHARGIVHRDLKPANLFATTRPDGSRLIKVLDFGISKAIDPVHTTTNQSLTASGSVIGSPMYMSPEQVRSSKAVDARSDIWSLGVILYELLTGVSPFQGETMGEVLAKIVADDPPPIAERLPRVPPDLATTISRCLTRKVEHRLQSVAELAANLLPFAEGEGALSVKRILRLSGQSSSSMNPVPAELASLQHSEPAPSPTARVWLRSGAVSGVPSRPRARRALVASAVLAAAIGVGFYALRRPSVPLETPPVASSSGRPSPAALPVEHPSQPAVTVASAQANPIEANAGDAGPMASAAPTTPSTNASPLAGVQPGTAAGTPRRLPPSVTPSPAVRNRPRGAADCDPPFTLDSAGYRVPKPECL